MEESNSSPPTRYAKVENRLVVSKLFLWNSHWRISSLHIKKKKRYSADGQRQEISVSVWFAFC